jgi:transcriptional regulator with XRE-family HTH domain
MFLLTALGGAIAKKRLLVQMSQQQLARASGVHRSYMSDVERGLRNITLATLENIAQALRTTSAELLEAHTLLANKRSHQTLLLNRLLR